MSMINFAEHLRQKIVERRKANHAQMDKGVEDREYLKLVGRNQQLNEFGEWITDVMSKIDSEDGETEL